MLHRPDVSDVSICVCGERWPCSAMANFDDDNDQCERCGVLTSDLYHGPDNGLGWICERCAFCLDPELLYSFQDGE